MWLLVASAPDEASVGQRDALLRLAGWDEAGRFGPGPAMRRGDLWLVTIPDLHLYHDDVDREAEAALGRRPDLSYRPVRRLGRNLQRRL